MPDHDSYLLKKPKRVKKQRKNLIQVNKDIWFANCHAYENIYCCKCTVFGIIFSRWYCNYRQIHHSFKLLNDLFIVLATCWHMYMFNVCDSLIPVAPGLWSPTPAHQRSGFFIYRGRVAKNTIGRRYFEQAKSTRRNSAFW